MQSDYDAIWQYFSKLRPRLRGNVQLYPQVYRAERWYVLHDQSSGQYLRLNQQAYAVLGRLDGELTLEEILEEVNRIDFEQPMSKNEVIRLIGQLNAVEVLSDGLPVNVQDVFGQYQISKRKKRRSSLMNPLSIKIPLLNPDHFLTRMAEFARLLFSRTGFWIWLLTLFSALVLALANKESLLSDIATVKLSPQQVIILWVVYPLVKMMHELGHGLALKAWGAKVPKMGINLLVFMPVPYVDATASWGFRNKWRRIIVGAAGIFVELFLASLALFLWLSVEPGLIKQAALNVILIATLSTLLFNGNPLLRYDGYFVLEDWLEIPNLATRAKRYYYYLIQKYLLKLPSAQNPVTAIGEEKWFLLYGFLAPLYRLFILLFIALYFIDSFLVIGVALAVWTIVMQLVVPLVKGVLFLIKSDTVSTQRFRGVGLALMLFVGLLGVLFIPVSTITYTEGVVWTKGESELSAGSSGFVKKVFVSSGTEVKANQIIMELEDIELQAEYKELKFKLEELNTQYVAQQRQNRVKAAMIQDDLHAIEMEFKQIEEKIEKLTIYSHADGKFVLARSKDITGNFIHKGEVIGHILKPENLVIRAVIPQSRMGLLETYKTSAEFKLADRMSRTFESEIIREIPQSTTSIPSATLGTRGGGTLAVDPQDESGTKLLKPIFQIDISLPQDLVLNRVGGRVYVRLDHGYLPIGEQIALSVNQLFLKHFYSK